MGFQIFVPISKNRSVCQRQRVSQTHSNKPDPRNTLFSPSCRSSCSSSPAQLHHTSSSFVVLTDFGSFHCGKRTAHIPNSLYLNCVHKFGLCAAKSTMTSTSNAKYDSYVKGILFGLINGIMVTPVMISFCTIIFRDAAYAEYLPSLVKLVLFSSLLHQLSFTLFSSLPFAIGQVQDAGLIFLSAMASNVAASCDKDVFLPTALFVLSVGTALMGVMLIVIGKLRLASVVQYLPMPVVGGYLAYIGFFCGQAGLAMMADVQVTSLTQWGLFWDSKALILLLPGVVAGCSIYILIVHLSSPYTLPASMVVVLALFYMALWVTDTSLDEAREYGWISSLSEPVPFYSAWQYYDISKVQWSVFPAQIISWVGMFFVVAFSSSLDIAAIEMELGLPMDYDRELKTVGISNLLSGLLGGYTGSYIFSQTIFTMRRGVESRVCGFTVVLCELAVMLLPVAITAFVPKFFFGSLLVFIAIDLMLEWLVAARRKMMATEYAVCLFTFVVIQYAGIELGMIIGIAGAMVSFVLSYASLKNVTVTAFRSSPMVRTFEEQAVLASCRGKVVTISLCGFIFFGSAVQLLEEVKRHVIVVEDDCAEANAVTDGAGRPSSTLSVGESTPLMKRLRTPPRSAVAVRQWAASSPIKMHSSTSTAPSQLQPAGVSYTSSASHSQSEASSAPSFSFLQNVYDMSSDQIMRHHERWKHSSSVDSTPRKQPVHRSSFHDQVHLDLECGRSSTGMVEMRPPEQNVFYSDDEGGMPPFDDAVAVEGEAESLLQSIWNTQVYYRRHRRRTTSESLRRSGPSSSNLQVQTFSSSDILTRTTSEVSQLSEGRERDPSTPAENDVRTEFLVLNFSDVSGVDATAARSCFLMLVQLLRGAGATVVFACPRKEIRQLLEAHGVILKTDRVMDNLDNALEWCEEQVLLMSRVRSRDSYEKERQNLAFSPMPKRREPSRVDALGLDASVRPIAASDSYYQTAWDDRQKTSFPISPPKRSPCEPFFEQTALYTQDATIDYRTVTRNRAVATLESLDFSPYRVLRRILLDYLEVDAGTCCPPGLKFVLKSQTLARYFTRHAYPASSTVHDIRQSATQVFFIERGVVQLLLPLNQSHAGVEQFHKVGKVSFGGIFGDVSFFLSRDYGCRATTDTDCVIWSLDQSYYAAMEKEDPQLCIILQHVLLKSMSMAQANAIHSMYPYSTYNLLFE